MEWTESDILMSKGNGSIAITVRNQNNLEQYIVLNFPSDVAIRFAEAILTSAVELEEEIQEAVERMISDSH